VTLLELAQGYAMFARAGRTCRATPFLDEESAGETQAFSPQVAYLISSALSDEALRVRAFGPSNALMLGFPVAVKTGTSSDFRDNWAIGYTERFTVAVWSGDFRNRSLNRLAGAACASPRIPCLTRSVPGTARRPSTSAMVFSPERSVRRRSSSTGLSRSCRRSSRCARRGCRRRLGAYACGVAACGCEMRSTEVERPEAR
jgi:membrane carboxypeptidase/penicillin-binding protein PbpC